MVFKKILVLNISEYIKRKRLFEALSSAYKIRFSPDFAPDEADGIISFNEDIKKKYNKPALFYFYDAGAFMVKKNILFKNARLDGLNYTNKTIYCDTIEITHPLVNFKEDEIIAEQDKMVIWAKKVHSGVNHYYSVVAPKELMDYENLKHLFFCSDLISALPLIVFIREILKNKNQDNRQRNIDPDTPVLEKYINDSIPGNENVTYHGGVIASVTAELVSGERLRPARYFDPDGNNF
jgi:hypothetical protein